MRRPFVFALVAFLSITAFLWLFILWPTVRTLSSLEAAKELKNKELEIKENYWRNLRELREKIQGLPPEKAALVKESLPDDPALPSLYEKLQQAAAESGLILVSIDSLPRESKEGSQLRSIDTIIEVEGRYEGLKEFLLRAGRTARLLNVKSVDFKSPEKGQIFHFSIGLEAYSY